jgi:hypothetical protein
MMKKILIILAVVALSGCAVNYTYEGQKYGSKEEFQQAIDSKMSESLSTITPLPVPVSKKKLIFAFPSEATLLAEDISRFVKAKGTQPIGPAKEIIENLSKSAYKNNKVYFDAIQKKNIYGSTQFIEMQATSGSYEASSDADTMYFIEPTPGSAQWYYHSSKGGKQIFAFDRSAPTPAGKIQAFVDAVLAQAIRD